MNYKENLKYTASRLEMFEVKASHERKKLVRLIKKRKTVAREVTLSVCEKVLSEEEYEYLNYKIRKNKADLYGPLLVWLLSDLNIQKINLTEDQQNLLFCSDRDIAKIVRAELRKFKNSQKARQMKKNLYQAEDELKILQESQREKYNNDKRIRELRSKIAVLRKSCTR